MNTRFVHAGLAALTIAVLAGCASTPTDQPATEGTAPAESVEEAVTLELPEGSTAEGVVLAAVLITNGDIGRAVEEGLVTPEEVELALAAIEEGTLQAWVDLAEQ